MYEKTKAEWKAAAYRAIERIASMTPEQQTELMEAVNRYHLDTIKQLKKDQERAQKALNDYVAKYQNSGN